MAIETKPVTITLKQVEGTARLQLETPVMTPQTDWKLIVHRESYAVDEKGTVYGEPKFGAAVIERSFGNIAGEAIEYGGSVYTVAEIAAVIKLFVDKFRNQDIEAGG